MSYHSAVVHSSHHGLGVRHAKFQSTFSLIAALFIFIGALWRFLKRRSPSLHGDARWASEWDIQKMGLRAKNGVLLGRYRNEFLVADGFEHVLCLAPTRSGKGVGVVIPNLLNWPGSAIVHDIKGENFAHTSGYRARHGHKVFFLNPGDPEGCTHGYNPFDYVSDKPGRRIDDIQKIAHHLLPDQEFWTNEARTLLVGLALYLIGCSPISLGLILRTIRGQGNFVEYIKQLLEEEGAGMDPVAYMALNAFAQKADKEQSAVLSTLNAALELWANPLIDAATSRSDFDLRRLKQERITIYVGVAPSNLQRLRPLMQIFYQQAIDMLSEKKPDPVKDHYPVLFLMDEFTSLGRMAQFEQGIAYLAGYGVRLLLIIQDIPQLEAKYGKSGMNVFMGNCKFRITFASNNYETAELISRHLGTFGAENVSENTSSGLAASWGTRSGSTWKVARALLLPQEILQLSSEEEIIMVEAAPPIRARKIRYFKEPVFQKRLIKSIAIPKVDVVAALLDSLHHPEPLTETEKHEALEAAAPFDEKAISN